MATLHFGGSQTLVPTTPASRREVIKGTFIDPNFVQLRKKSVQEFFAKPGSNPASKFKFLAFVEADKQRTKILPSPFRCFGIAANDEFLVSLAAFVIRKGNGNASKIVCVRAIEPSEIHRVSYAVFLT